MATLPKSLSAPLQPAKGLVSRSTASKPAAARAARREPIGAAKAKTHFLQLLDEVERDRQPIVITKRGRIVAQLVPAPQTPNPNAFNQVFGSLRGTGRILGDIVSPDHEGWGPKWR